MLKIGIASFLYTKIRIASFLSKTLRITKKEYYNRGKKFIHPWGVKS